MATTGDRPPTVTAHAREQWWDRATDPDETVATAWSHSQRVDAGGPFRNCDAVRYHRPTGTLLVAYGRQIATVYDADDLDPDYERAVAHVLDGGGE